jgi:hypothetical protein
LGIFLVFYFVLYNKPKKHLAFGFYLDIVA